MQTKGSDEAAHPCNQPQTGRFLTSLRVAEYAYLMVLFPKISEGILFKVGSSHHKNIPLEKQGDPILQC